MENSRTCGFFPTTQPQPVLGFDCDNCPNNMTFNSEADGYAGCVIHEQLPTSEDEE